MSAASAIRSQLRKQDIVCRWGEGGFCYCLPEQTPMARWW
jgi:PleD family two-component response regulator